MALPRFDPFLPLLAGIMVLGIALPLAAPLQHPLGLVSDAGVAGLFLFHGAVLKPRELWTGMGHWRLHGLSFSITFIAFPLAGAVLCLSARSAGLPQDLATGLLFLTLLPSAVSSSIAFTAMAHGHVAAAMCNAAASNVAGLVLTPLLALAAGSLMGGVSNAVFANPGDALLRVGLQMAAPFALGQALRRWIAPLFSERPGRLQRYDEGVILLIVYLAVSGAAKDGLLARVSPWAFAAVALVCLGLFALAFILATLGARRLGLSRRDEIAAVFCASKKSLATGLPLAHALFAGAPGLGVILLPIILYNQIQILAGSVLARRYLRDAGRRSVMPGKTTIGARNSR